MEKTKSPVETEEEGWKRKWSAAKDNQIKAGGEASGIEKR